MTFKPRLWFPIATVLSLLNLGGAGFAAQAGEGWHATAHAVLAVAFALWAQRLRRGSGGGEQQARLEALEAELIAQGQELNEALERLDFAERLMAQREEARRVGPEG